MVLVQIWWCSNRILVMYRVNPYFRTMLLMTRNQSLHLRIDDMVRLIPISMRPAQLWRCEDWIFLATWRCSYCTGMVHAPPNKSIYIIYVH